MWHIRPVVLKKKMICREHLLSSALVRTKIWKNRSMNGSQQKGKILLAWYSQIARKVGKMYNMRIKQFLSVFRI